jgi:hypothetical protein
MSIINNNKALFLVFHVRYVSGGVEDPDTHWTGLECFSREVVSKNLKYRFKTCT